MSALRSRMLSQQVAAAETLLLAGIDVLGATYSEYPPGDVERAEAREARAALFGHAVGVLRISQSLIANLISEFEPVAK